MPSFRRVLDYVLSGGTERRAFVSTPEQRNKNVNKYLISSSGDRTHNQSVTVKSHFVPLRHYWPRPELCIILNICD